MRKECVSRIGWGACPYTPLKGSLYCRLHDPQTRREREAAADVLNQLIGPNAVRVDHQGELILSLAAAEKIATALRKEPTP